MAPSLTAVALAIVVSATVVLADNNTCFNLYGQEDDSLRPCDPSAEVSACCRKDDICLSSGLCMSTASAWAGFIWANGCTDATHADPKCPNQCTDKTSVNASSSFNVLQCTYPFTNGSVSRDPQWCCRSATDYDNCCGTPELTFNDTQNIGLFLTPGSTKAINPADAYVLASDCASNDTSSNNTTLSDNATSSCPANHTAAVGGAVGGVLGALLIGALAAIVLLLRGRKNLKSQVTSTTSQRDDALKQINDEKGLVAQLRQQQEAQQAHFAASGGGVPPMLGYQQSGAFGHSPSPAPSYGGGHIYGQYSESQAMQGTPNSMSPPPAEMSATKYVEMDGHAASMELSVEEVKPTPAGSARGGSVKSKTSS